MITIFENFSDDGLPKFNLGDVVYCVDDDNTSGDIRKDTKYIIRAVIKGQNNYLYYIKDPNSEEKPESKQYLERRFMSEMEYKANKYNI